MTRPDWMEHNQVCALVLDDHDEIRKLIAEILHGDGHIVVEAASGEEAMSYLPHYTFQVAYLDHQLPGLEGFAIGEYLRRNNPHMQIALVTAQLGEDLERLCREQDIQYIAKPFDVGAITQLVLDYLQQARQRLETAAAERSENFHPDWRGYVDEIGAYFDMPSVPSRIDAQLQRKLGEAMLRLRSAARFSERDRVMALSGLLTAQLLGLRLNKGPAGRSLYEEYDRIMEKSGRLPVFEGDAEEEGC